jgi:hypothetical protein
VSQNGDFRPYKPRTFNGQSRQRFFRHYRKAYYQQVGGSPTPGQCDLIERIIRLKWDLAKLDARQDSEDLSDHAARNKYAWENRLRLDLRDLGLQRVPPKAPTLEEQMAAAKAERERQGAAA